MEEFEVLVEDYIFVVRRYSKLVIAENKKEAKKIAKELWEQDIDQFQYEDEHYVDKYQNLQKTKFTIDNEII